MKVVIKKVEEGETERGNPYARLILNDDSSVIISYDILSLRINLHALSRMTKVPIIRKKDGFRFAMNMNKLVGKEIEVKRVALGGKFHLALDTRG
jgi:hypothetical protein